MLREFNNIVVAKLALFSFENFPLYPKEDKSAKLSYPPFHCMIQFLFHKAQSLEKRIDRNYCQDREDRQGHSISQITKFSILAVWRAIISYIQLDFLVS